MSMKLIRNNNTLELAGRIDAENAPQFEEEINSMIDNADSLELNLNDLEYISSAGLRVILKAHRAFSEKKRSDTY